MKLSIIGFGQCGGNITDEFYAVNNYAKSFFNRHIAILTDAFAVNTDEADLGGFRHIPKDKTHRILIGAMSTFGHGVGKMNTEAAAIIKACNSMVVDSIMKSQKFHESDAVITIASGGGGTGSGTIGWAIKALKERMDKPVYAIIVLPFAFEERGNTSYAVTNTATCINTVLRYADAVFLVDNERYRKPSASMAQNLKETNQEIALSFYDLCCAGEETRQKYIGSKVVDAGDIKHSLQGISALGRGQIGLGAFRWSKEGFREGVKEQSHVLGALRTAVGNLGLSVELEDARKVLALVCAPKDTVTVSSVEEISNFLQEKAPKAVVRIGDYPRRGKEVAITLIASEMAKVNRVERLFMQAEDLFKKQHEISQETEVQIGQIMDLTRNIPTLD
ncbi:MAG: hypothetical protein HY667_03200 [Chloroflexi bacterium]|nr:hypothetical protein [Chloroflexota bacterium]